VLLELAELRAMNTGTTLAALAALERELNLSNKCRNANTPVACIWLLTGGNCLRFFVLRLFDANSSLPRRPASFIRFICMVFAVCHDSMFVFYD
jgi:hypothetical protein